MERKFKSIHIVTLSYLILVSYALDKSEYDSWNITDESLERTYSLSTCNYNIEGGYTCLSCIRALHCYPVFAILVDCPLLFPYCRNGRCSRYEDAKCAAERFSTTTIVNIAHQSASVVDDTSEISNEVVVISKDGLVEQEQLETTTETLLAEE